jgi:uncharacterized YccA/Bax inhibitor family protein
MGGLDGDRVVALLGVVMCMALMWHGGALRRIDGSTRLKYALIWAAVFTAGSLVAGFLLGGG